MRDLFITNMGKVEIQKKPCFEFLTHENVLAYVLAHEKGTRLHQQYVITPAADFSHRNLNVKYEPILNISKNQKCQNCGQLIKKGYLSVCPVRERSCNICGRKRYFAKH